MEQGPSGQGGFASPTRGDTGEDAAVPFEPPPMGSLSEQAAFTAPGELSSGIMAQILDARNELEQVLKRRIQIAGPQALSAFASEEGNIQGVGIGLGEPGQGEPGAPTLTIFVAERASAEQVRATVTDSVGIQSASDVPITVRTSGIFDAQPHRFRERAAPGGISIGHPNVTAGTLGCLAVGRSAPRNNRLLLLSNNHVIAASNAAAFGDCISQPGPAESGACPADEIAILERFVPLVFDGTTNHVDCATAWCWPDRVRRELLQIVNGTPQYFLTANQVVAPQLGMLVGKSGRTTQVTQGRITAVDVATSVNYNGRPAFFAGQFVVEGLGSNLFSRGGDSGSCVWTWNPVRNPVGLLFAGGANHTICNPMSSVLSALDINLYT